MGNLLRDGLPAVLQRIGHPFQTAELGFLLFSRGLSPFRGGSFLHVPPRLRGLRGPVSRSAGRSGNVLFLRPAFLPFYIEDIPEFIDALSERRTALLLPVLRASRADFAGYSPESLPGFLACPAESFRKVFPAGQVGREDSSLFLQKRPGPVHFFFNFFFGRHFVGEGVPAALQRIGYPFHTACDFPVLLLSAGFGLSGRFFFRRCAGSGALG